jgi:hypothetical protein
MVGSSRPILGFVGDATYRTRERNEETKVYIKHQPALGFHRLVVNSDISLEYLPNMAIRLLVNSAITLKSSNGDLIATSLLANSKANCMLA